MSTTIKSGLSSVGNAASNTASSAYDTAGKGASGIGNAANKTASSIGDMTGKGVNSAKNLVGKGTSSTDRTADKVADTAQVTKTEPFVFRLHYASSYIKALIVNMPLHQYSKM